MNEDQMKPPSVAIAPGDGEPPVKKIDGAQLRSLGQNLSKTFDKYAEDRTAAEKKWLRNLRQYLGIYDPDIERKLEANRSRAYPRLTRVKCISVLSRIMNLMFPGNERSWELRASPSADMDPDDVMQAIQKMMQKEQEEGQGQPGQTGITDEMIDEAVQSLADQRAELLSTVIDDQLEELGGSQNADFIRLNHKVAKSGIMFGVGVLRGPYVRTRQRTKWYIDEQTGQPTPQEVTQYRPMFDFLPVWDFYPDMGANTLDSMDGYFARLVMSRSQLRALGKREDFFEDQIKAYLKNNRGGNYKPPSFEQELKSMGTKANVDDEKPDASKYEVIVWHGPVSGKDLEAAGVDVPEGKVHDDFEAEIWIVDKHVIKADMNAWAKMGLEVKTIHPFLFDEDDTSPVGNGLPNVMRDSQMSVASATRMMLDNAGVTCGPNLEINTDLLRPDQDLDSVDGYKIWYREGFGADASYPAVRQIKIDGHLNELQQMVTMFMGFADIETFVGPATGGDMSQGPSEPMRTAAGASMLRGDAALPFKDIVRNFDVFTQSVITSLVHFNRKFNPDSAPPGDYNVVARGATSLIAKEVRGIQVDQLAQTLSPEDRVYIDEEKFMEARFKVRDLGNLLASKDEVRRRKAANAARAKEQEQQQGEMMAAQIRDTLANAFKNIAQGQKNSASGDATLVNAALSVLTAGVEEAENDSNG